MYAGPFQRINKVCRLLVDKLSSTKKNMVLYNVFLLSRLEKLPFGLYGKYPPQHTARPQFDIYVQISLLVNKKLISIKLYIKTTGQVHHDLTAIGLELLSYFVNLNFLVKIVQ